MMKLMMKNYAGFGLVLTLMVAVALTACGGGGGGSGSAGGGGTTTCIVTYDGNDADDGNVPVDDTDYEEGQTVTVLGNTGDLVKAGYAYAGWNTLADGSGTTYTQGQTFTMEAADITLYVQWTANPTYTVTYDGNGADGEEVPVDTTHYEEGQTVTVLGNSGNLVRDGFTFTGWNTQADGSGATYTQDQTFAMGAADVIFYAKWTSNPTTLSINSTAGLDGLVSCTSDPYYLEPGTISSLSVTFNDPTIKIGARHPVASDKVLIARGLLSFDLSSLAGKTITNAVLKVHILSVTANDPFDTGTGLGGLLVDHFTTNYTTDTAMDILFIGMLPNVSGAMSADQGWRVINVTNEVAADQTAGRNSQYRLHFENELAVSSSQKEIDIESGENANNKPVLIVTYQ